jgi:hypothetical protein
MTIEKFMNSRRAVFIVFCIACMVSPTLQSATCQSETDLSFLIDKIGEAIREAERSESAGKIPRMSIVSVSISVTQQAKESDAGGINLSIPVFVDLKAAVEFSKSESSKIVQELKFAVAEIPVSAATLSSNLINAINRTKKAMRHAMNVSKYLEPSKMKFSQDFEVVCGTNKKASIVLLGYEGTQVRGGSNSITFEFEVN